jgi:hypothetical protein
MSQLLLLSLTIYSVLWARDRLLEIRQRRTMHLARVAVDARQEDGKMKAKHSTGLANGGAFGA